MDHVKMSKIVLEAAECLEKESFSAYPKDLGYWGMEESKIDELVRHLRKLKVSIKIYDLDEEEFPKLSGKNLVELELKSDASSSKKVIDILKRIRAFPIEEHHVSNLKEDKAKEKEHDLEEEKLYNTCLSGMETPDELFDTAYETMSP